MSELPEEPRAFGFTRDEWVRSGAFTAAGFDRLAAKVARGENTVVANQGWMLLARLGPAYARAAWERIGPGMERMVRALEAQPPDAILLEMRARIAADLEALRRLAGQPPGD